MNKVYIVKGGEKSFSMVVEGKSNMNNYYVSWIFFTKNFLHRVVKVGKFTKRGGRWICEVETPKNTKYVTANLMDKKGNKIILLSDRGEGFYYAYFIGGIEGPALLKAGNKYKLSVKFKTNFLEKDKKTLKCKWSVEGTGIGIVSLGNPTFLPDGTGICKALVYVEKGEAHLGDIKVELIGK